MESPIGRALWSGLIMLGNNLMNRRALAFIMVSFAVGLSLCSAVVLKEAANRHHVSLLLLTALILFVLLLNILRVILWSAIHKRFRLSDSYPLTSLFFPMILVLSIFYGENIGLTKLIGTAFITLGVLVLTRDKKNGTANTESVQDVP